MLLLKLLKYEKPDITVVSGKGQVVIPQAIREKLGIGLKIKLLVTSYQDAVVMKKMDIPDVRSYQWCYHVLRKGTQIIAIT